MLRYCSNKAGQRLSRKQRHGDFYGQGCPKELRTLIERCNDLYEIREAEFVRVLFRRPDGFYSNVTISAAHRLSDEEIVALAIREYGVPSMESVMVVQHVMYQYLSFEIENLELRTY